MGRFIALLSLLVLLGIACTLSGHTPAPTLEVPTQPQVEAQTETPIPTAIASTNIPAAGQVLEGPNINFNGVRFTLDPALGSRIYVFDDWIMSPRDGKTAHSLHFVLRDRDYEYCWTWCIDIYRVADFEQAFGTFVFPPSGYQGGAAVIFEAQKKALSFQNGNGDRGLEEFAQSPYPVTNELLKYVFRGYSADKQYGIYVQAPIHAAGLPDVAPTIVPGVDPFPDLMNNNQKALQTVNSLAPADFTPNLDLLGALVASIRVESP